LPRDFGTAADVTVLLAIAAALGSYRFTKLEV
jgi:hypothetical protein